MCGISGEISFSKHADVHSILAMGESLKHRGNDGTFNYVKDNIAISFNWLAITDKSSPPPIKHGKWVVWLNGEVYNYLELKKQFISDKVSISDCTEEFIEFSKFSTKSDTEVVAIGIEKEGLGFIKKLNGIFVIVAYNTESHTLHIARDRFGAKQIYYYSTPTNFIFASEPKAFLKHKDYSFDINKNAVGQWLTYQNYFSDEILFDKIKLLQPGTIIHCLPVPIKETYHKWEFSEDDISVEDIKQSVAKTCALQRPEESLGLWLSGGLDSSILAMEMNPEYCITAGWEEKEYDERKASEIVSYSLKGIHQQIFLKPNNYIECFEDTIRALDDLRAGPSWSNFILNKVISKHCRITIQGTGADEFFGGYQWRYDEPDYYKIIDRTKFKNGFIKNDFLCPNLPKNIHDRYEFDVKHFLQGILIVGDRLSMAHGLEERVPFLDNDLCEMALKIKLKDKHNKNILRKAFNNIPNTKKKGFTSPDKIWYQRELHVYAEKLLHSKNLDEYIDKKQLPEIIKNNNAPALWSLLALDAWIKIYAHGK